MLALLFLSFMALHRHYQPCETNLLSPLVFPVCHRRASESDEDIGELKVRASEFRVATLKRGSLGMWKAAEGFDT